jgi:peptidoglycan/LPS O-acetylase OafA/YrhL
MIADTQQMRIPALDGVRGIAILLVLWFHFMPDIALPLRALEWLRKTSTAGWIGVDLFFALSGFLITRVLLEAKSSNHYYRNFFARRILRIFPLYYASLGFVLLIVPALGILQKDDVSKLNNAAVWLWTYCANIGWMLQVPIRTAWPTELFDLRHFWSLAVEEHFYLVWPFVVARTNIRQLKMVCCLLFLLSFSGRLIWVLLITNETAIVNQTLFRLDGLAAGALVAVIFAEGNWRWLIPWAKIAICLLSLPLIAFFLSHGGLWDGNWFIRTFGISFLAIIFAACIMLCLETKRHDLVARVLTSRLLGFFGKYSYGIYVIHGIIGAPLNQALPVEAWLADFGPVLTIVAVISSKLAASSILALLSWHLMEKQIMRLKRYFPTTAVPTMPIPGLSLQSAGPVANRC